MEAKGELLTIAGLAVTLIGFSGLIFVFRPRETPDRMPRDFTAAAIVICAGNMGLLFSLLPFVLAHAGLSPGTIWAITSVLFSIGLFAGGTIFVIVSRRLSQAGYPARAPRLNRITVSLAAALALGLLANAFWVAPPQRPAVYLAALIFLLIIPACFIAFLLVVVGSERR